MALHLMELRKKAGYKSRDAFAEKIGVNRHTYKTWETGSVTMNADQLLMIAKELGCSCDAILGNEVQHEFDDPMEEALHMTWLDLNLPEKQEVLKYAQERLALQRVGDAVEQPSRADAGGEVRSA